ncbi:MAG: ATP-binding protein [Kineosporiaceae bacterium]
MTDTPPTRWDRLLSGLDEALERRLKHEAARAGAETWLGPSTDPALNRFAGAVDAVHEAWEQAPELLDSLGDALDALAARADLAPFDVDLLAIALGCDIDPSFGAALEGIRAGDVAGRPAVQAALEVLGVPTAHPQARARLTPSGLLHRTGLLRVSGRGPLLTRTLELPDRVAAHLLGDDTPPPALASSLLRCTPLPLPGSQRLAQLWHDGEALVIVSAPAGTSGTAMAAGAADALGRGCVGVDLARTHPRRRPEVLDSAVLEAVVRGAALVLVGALPERGPAPDDREATGRADDARDVPELDPPALLARLAGLGVPVALVVAGHGDPAWASWLPPVVPAPRLDAATREALWRGGLGEEPERDPAWVDLLALQVTPEEVHTVLDLTRAGDSPAPGAGAALAAARRLADRAGSTRTSAVTLDDLVVPEHTRAELDRLVSWARHRDAVLAQGPLTGKGKGRGIAALFAGGPGTGKTLAAQAVAGTLGLGLHHVDLTTVVDKYIGESEKRLEKVFTTAERLNCVLFFDEADSLFGNRSQVSDARDRYANLEVSYLLQRMEAFDGIVVLTTNLRGNLDPAFTRRLHFVVHFPDPDLAARAGLWQAHLRHVARFDDDDPVDVDRLAAAADVAGGAVRNAVLDAAFAAWEDNGGAVGMRHVRDALDREVRKLGRRGLPVE